MNIIPAWEVLQINILLEKNVLDIIIQKNPADVTETLKEITGGGSHFLSLLFFGIGVLAILFALIRVWAVITLI